MPKQFELPDGEVITISKDRFICPEALFQPSLLETDEASQPIKGIHENTFDSIIHCDVDIQTEMFANVVLSGGSTKFPGLAERLRLELNNRLLSPTTSVKIHKPKSENCAWTGGSALAAFLSSQQTWITRQEYEESGTIIVHQKCF